MAKTRTKIHFIFILLLFALKVSANTADSLKVLLGDIHDTNNYRIYRELYYRYLESNIDSALLYSQKGLKQAEIEKNLFQIGKFNKSIGTVYFYKGYLNIAILYYRRAYEKFLEIGDVSNSTRELGNIGIMLINVGKYEKASEILFKAIKQAERTGNKQSMSFIYSNIGRLFHDQGNDKKAIEYYRKSLKSAEKINYRKPTADTYNRLGNLYKSNYNFDSAIYYFNKSLEINENIRERSGELDNTMNIGDTYLKMGNFKKALIYYKKHYKLNLEYNSESKLASNWDAFGDYYTKTGEIDQAIKSYYKSVSIYKKLGKSNELRESYQKISEAYKLNNNYDSALYYYELYTNMKDSIFTIEKSRQIAELESIYETEKKEKEILNLEKEQEQKRSQILLLGGMSALLFILIVFSFIFYRSRQKSLVLKAIAKEQKKHFKAVVHAQEQERKRIAGELHDSVGPLLSVTSLYLSDLSDSISESKKEHAGILQKSLKILEEANTETRNISHNLMPGVLIRSGLVPACRELVRKIKDAGTFDIQFQTEGCNKRLEETIEITFYRVLQELLNNIIKHAKASQVEVHLIRQNGTLELSASDNGKGFAAKNGKFNGIGLQNMQSRLSLINGSFTIDSTENRGTTVLVIAPVTG